MKRPLARYLVPGLLCVLVVSFPVPAAATPPAGQHGDGGCLPREEEAQAAAPANPTDAELKPTVPALVDLHQVVYPLWHTAYPARDVKMMRDLWPEVARLVAAVQQAELPGILRDKKDAWRQGVARLEAARAAYGAALEPGKEKDLLKAIEELHASFEQLVRVVRPVTPELAAFHQVLYRIYHYDLPAEDLASLRARMPELRDRTAALLAVPLPPRWAGVEESYVKARAELAARVKNLSETVERGVWDEVAASVEAMHTAYVAVQAVFD